jgi:hypothetical protein
MKFRLATALALSLAFTSMTAPAALAQQQTSQFRTVEPQTFTADELQRYGLSAEDAAQVQAYQEQGYQVAVLTPDEAEQYTGGLSTRTWLIIGLVVVVIAVAAAD